MRIIEAIRKPSSINQPMRMTVKRQDPGDGSGDIIVNLPPEILKGVGVTVGDQLSIELIDSVDRAETGSSCYP